MDEVTLVAAFGGMDYGTQLKHLECRHGASGFRDQLEWIEYHEAVHRAELSHTHTADVAPNGSSATSGPGVGDRPSEPGAVAGGGVPVARFQAPVPTEAQKRSAWSCDLRNAAYVSESRGTTVIVNEDDYWDEWD